MASEGYTGGINGDGNFTGLKLEVVTAGGESHGSFDAPCGEKVDQFIKRLGLDAEAMSAECIVLLHGDQILQPDNTFQNHDVPSGATLTIVRERPCQLRLASFACATPRDTEFSWLDESLQASELSAGVMDWCRKFAPKCCIGSYGAVCTLENPAQMQRLVDSGGLSKAAAVEAILAFFIRSLLAVGRLGCDHNDMHQVADSADNVAATAILREYLPEVSCKVDLLSRKEAHNSETFAILSERYLKHVQDNDAAHFHSFEKRVKDGLMDEFRLDACDEMDISLWDDEAADFIGLREFLAQQGVQVPVNDEYCQDGWLKLVKLVNCPGNRNMIFNVDADGNVLAMNCMMRYRLAAGVYLEGEESSPDQLPTHYLFLAGDDND